MEIYKLTAGLRVDVPSFKQTALENSQVAGYTFKDEAGNPIQVEYFRITKDASLVVSTSWVSIGMSWATGPFR